MLLARPKAALAVNLPAIQTMDIDVDLSKDERALAERAEDVRTAKWILAKRKKSAAVGLAHLCRAQLRAAHLALIRGSFVQESADIDEEGTTSTRKRATTRGLGVHSPIDPRDGRRGAFGSGKSGPCLRSPSHLAWSG